MKIHYPPAYEPATPEYVLEVLRRHCDFDSDCHPDFDFRFESTVSEWIDACDLGWDQRAGRAMNEYWNLKVTPKEWDAVLQPADVRTLRDLCEFLAPRIQRIVIRPTRFFGRECREAGAFLAIRSILNDHGVAIDDVRPSTLLAPFTRLHPSIFSGPISDLSFGSLPEIRVRHPFYDMGLAVYLLAVATAYYLYFAGWHWLILTVLVAAGFALHSFTALRVKPHAVSYGDLKTFGDLARCLAAGKCEEI